MLCLLPDSFFCLSLSDALYYIVKPNARLNKNEKSKEKLVSNVFVYPMVGV